MKEIRLFRGKVALVDDDDFEELRRWQWLYKSNGYVYRVKHFKVNGKRKAEHIYMHRVINKTPEGMPTKHINGNLLDNRKKNLTIG